ncbi:MAG: moeA1 [Bacteroidetes bacterium]|nr:moeA1 [Bacteroidota bacterium]
MVNADTALSIILESAPSIGTEKVPVADTLGRTCAKNISADVDLPSFDNSAMDGYALLSSCVKAASPNTPVTLAVVGECSAGNPFDGAVGSGESVQIMTGGMVPRGADSVVPFESVRLLSEDKIECVEASPVGMPHHRSRTSPTSK